ncbi:WXG100 family type VII secretion target [Saccharopolyspora sp. 5N708]|uniref:WXG100 family type VII secretion target n=1 Tax=Saccharopolyspora sp. 5N708 TaxID=3457424 RepID=UPI003FCF1061
MGGFRSDLGKLGEHASEFDDLAGRAQRIADTLRGVVEAAGACWGGDDIGANFARSHCDRADRALDELSGMSAGLREMGAKFAATAATTQQADVGGADGLGRISGGG